MAYTKGWDPRGEREPMENHASGGKSMRTRSVSLRESGDQV